MRTLLRNVALGLSLALVALAPASAQQDTRPWEIFRAMAIQEVHSDALMELAGVVGTAVGIAADGEASILVLAEDLWVGRLPRRIEGMPVKIRITGPIQAERHEARRRRDRRQEAAKPVAVDRTGKFEQPVPIGVSAGNAKSCSTGTIGARITDGTNVYALSNNHVFAMGSRDQSQLGDVIVQPGLFDTDCIESAATSNALGTLAAYVPLDFDGGDNYVDAAIAISDAAMLGNATPVDGYGSPLANSEVAALVGQRVKKYGRTTGLTAGRVVAVNAIVNVTYAGGKARFVDQIIVEGDKAGFLNPGDSGSLLVEEAGQGAVGLLFAAGRGGRIAIANPIGHVLDELSALTGTTLWIDGAVSASNLPPQ